MPASTSRSLYPASGSGLGPDQRGEHEGLSRFDRMVASLAEEGVHGQRAKSAAFIGGLAEIRDTIADYARQIGGFDVASLQVNPKLLAIEKAKASMRLSASAAMPKFASVKA